jgi:hypothetical protein
MAPAAERGGGLTSGPASAAAGRGSTKTSGWDETGAHQGKAISYDHEAFGRVDASVAVIEKADPAGDETSISNSSAFASTQTRKTAAAVAASAPPGGSSAAFLVGEEARRNCARAASARG